MRGTAFEVFSVFLRLGLTSFGGPVAHIGYFRTELVDRRRWLDEATFADLVALCQFMPGPASSQTGMAIGLLRAGPGGMLAAWVGFTLPSAVIMTMFAFGVSAVGDVSQAAWLRGLKLVAVAVVAQAVWSMARTLAPDRMRGTVAVAATLVTLAIPSSLGQVTAIALGGVAGLLLPGVRIGQGPKARLLVGIPRWLAIGLLGIFVGLLVVLPVIGEHDHTAALFDAFYRAGALVFGGGHVVLPLLQASIVTPGWVSNDAFMAGYGATQAMPGPIFTFAAYLGALETAVPNGVLGAALAIVAIFLPSFLLIGGLLPFWDMLRHVPAVQHALRGVNASVVGVLLAALFTPIWTGAVHTAAEFSLVLTAFLAMVAWAVPPWMVVLAGAAAGPLFL